MASFLPDDPRKQKMVLLGLLPVATAALYYYFVHSPAVVQADELEARVEMLVAKNDAQRAVVARFGEDLDRRLAIYSEHIGQLEQLIPRREDVPLLINQVTQQARDYGVELVGLRPSSEEPGEYYNRQYYELQVIGDYHSIGAYLASIGSLSRIMRPYNVRISMEGTRAGAPVLRGRFSIETFVMPGDSLLDLPDSGWIEGGTNREDYENPTVPVVTDLDPPVTADSAVAGGDTTTAAGGDTTTVQGGRE